MSVPKWSWVQGPVAEEPLQGPHLHPLGRPIPQPLLSRDVTDCSVVAETGSREECLKQRPPQLKVSEAPGLSQFRVVGALYHNPALALGHPGWSEFLWT